MNARTRNLLIGLIVAGCAFGLGAQNVQTSISRAHLAWKQQSPLLKIRSGGEVIAELRLLKPTRLDIEGIQTPQRAGVLRTSGNGEIVITTDGLSPWRLTGAGLEVDIPDQKAQND